jgi:hypothetical protein
MSEGELEKRFPDLDTDRLPMTSKGPMAGTEPSKEAKNIIPQAEVWEIWDKSCKKVFWYVPNYPKILEQKDDPLELDQFFPDPPPMVANVTTSRYMPRADYTIAQSLYRAIDILETRISLLTSACKLVGVYDKANEGVQRMFNEGVENQLIPVDNWAMFAEKGGLKGSIDWLPLEAVILAVDKLTEKQQQKIQQLYELTGFSDIMRGASQQAYTSAAETKVKAQFASIRVQALQDEFARFASDLQRLKVEIIQKHFQPYCIRQQSNIDSTPDAQLADQAIALIKDPLKARWKITVRPESLALADYQQLKADRMEYIMGLSQFMQSAAPLVTLDKGVVPILLELLKWGLAGFKGSTEIEGVLDRAVSMFQQKANAPPEQAPPSPEQLKAQAEQAQAQLDMQAAQQRNTMEAERAAAEHAASMETIEANRRRDQLKYDMDIRKMNRQYQIDMDIIEAKGKTDVVVQAAQTQFDTQSAAVDTALGMKEKEHATALQIRSHNETNDGDST